jgi:hypothetical protein
MDREPGRLVDRHERATEVEDREAIDAPCYPRSAPNPGIGTSRDPY